MPDFRLQYVSGTIRIPAAGGSPDNIVKAGVEVIVRNVGEREEEVRVVIHIAHNTFDSAEDKDGKVPPGREWGYDQILPDVSGGRCWITVSATSRNLVPSAEFTTDERHTSESRYATDDQPGLRRPYTYAWISPRDFAVFRIPGGGPLAPEDEFELDLDLDHT